MLPRAIRQIVISVALLACGLGCATVAAAAGVTISPVVIEIDAPRRAVAVTVTNNGDQPITLQTEAMVWRQVNGADTSEPTDDLLVVPPIVTVPAAGSQVFRVMLRAPVPAPQERTYRLMLEDISAVQATTEQTAVTFRLTHNLPVMVAPAGQVVNAVRWKPCETPVAGSATPAKTPEAGIGQACVRLQNAGNRRIKVQTLTLAGDDWRQAISLKSGENILAGAEREWRVPLPAGQAGALRAVQVQTALGQNLAAEAGGF